jgi:hypothetical protein
LFDDLKGYLIRHRCDSDQLHQETMSSLLDIKRMGSILERKSSSARMRDRDTAGGRITSQDTRKKRKKIKGHYRKNWDIDLWD